MHKAEPRLQSIHGYSHVELMMVVGLLGVVAVLSLPRFRQFERNAKMAEARSMLQHIVMLEKSYKLNHQTYMNFGPLGANLNSRSGQNNCLNLLDEGATLLGYTIAPCVESAPVPRYAYGVSGAGRELFVASATTGKFDSNRICEGNDQHYLAINQNNIFYGRYASRTPENRDDLLDLSPETACPND